jgi:septum formation protein
VTAFCLKDSSKTLCFDDMSEVTFKKIDLQEIKNYVDQFNPYDKAGAYGAQDCLPKGVNPCSQEEIDFLKRVNKMDLAEKTFTSQAVGTGILAIEKIKGSYFNVMGLPIHKVYDELEAF